MEIKGKIIGILESETGTSKAGKSWESQVCVIDTGAEYNNKIALKFMGDKVSLLQNLSEGDNVHAHCNVYSREYNGRFFNNIDCWRIALSNTDDIKSSVDDAWATSDDNPF
tara:strand:- start:11941 stop:12273 length:333 start_codon:yes stop_codon:yes gene_type:complete